MIPLAATCTPVHTAGVVEDELSSGWLVDSERARMEGVHKGRASMPIGEYITLREASEISGYTASHLRRLLIGGKLEGGKFGHVWFTTVEALEKYRASKPRPGPRSTRKD